MELYYKLQQKNQKNTQNRHLAYYTKSSKSLHSYSLTTNSETVPPIQCTGSLKECKEIIEQQ